MDRVYNITYTYIYIYRVYVDSHSLGQLALASKRTASDRKLDELDYPTLRTIFESFIGSILKSAAGHFRLT